MQPTEKVGTVTSRYIKKSVPVNLYYIFSLLIHQLTHLSQECLAAEAQRINLL